MKKIFSFLGALVALCLTFNVSAQTLLFDAAGSGTSFAKIGGTANYTLNLNGHTVTDGKVQITEGKNAVGITMNPTIASAGGGFTIVMYVSNVDVTKGGSFCSVGESTSSRRGGIKINSNGKFQFTWQNGTYQNELTAVYPGDNSANVVSFAFKRNDNGGGKGSSAYFNGTLLGSNAGLQWTNVNAEIALGGIASTSTTFLNTGMKIHRVQIYAGELTVEQLSTVEEAIKQTPTIATYTITAASDSEGSASLDGGVTSLSDVAFGTSVTATATASSAAYEFEKWVSLADEAVTISTANPYTFTASADLDLKAKFKLKNVLTTATPVADDGKWYYIKSQRSASATGVSSAMNVPNFWTVQTDNTVKPQTLTLAENQMFQLVSTASSKVTINAKSGNTASFNGNKLVFSGTTPLAGFTLKAKTINGIQGYQFTENSGLHQAEGGNGWNIINWYGENDNCTFFFYEAISGFEFRQAIETAKSLLANTAIGNSLGCTTQENIDIFRSAIATAIEALEGTEEEVAAAKSALAAATTTFNNAKIQLVSSTDENPVYYYITSKQATYAKDKVIYTVGQTDKCKWGDSEPTTLNKLFRVEKHATNATYRLINAAYPGEMVANGLYGTTNTTYWTITPLTGNEGPQFKIEGNGILHAQQSGNAVVNYNGGYNEGSAWTFVPFTGDTGPLYQVQYDALVDQHATLVDENGNPIGFILGTNVGEYSADLFEAIKTAYSAMVDDWTAGGSTIKTTMAAYSTSVVAFKASRVMPKPFNGTFAEGGQYMLRYKKSDSPLNRQYLMNPRTTTVESDRPQGVLTETFDKETCVWEFIPSTSAGRYLIVSTRHSTEDGKREYLDEEGRVRSTESYGDSGWTTKSLLQNTTEWSSSSSLIIKIDHNAAYYFIGTGGDLGRNDNAWAEFELELFTATDVDQAAQMARPIVIDGSIQLVGADSIEVYNTTGVNVQNKNLKPGLYIAKANGTTYKVIVK